MTQKQHNLDSDQDYKFLNSYVDKVLYNIKLKTNIKKIINITVTEYVRVEEILEYNKKDVSMRSTIMRLLLKLFEICSLL